MNDSTPSTSARPSKFPLRPIGFAALGVVVLLLVLALAAYWFAPGVIRQQLLAACAQSLTRTPSIGRIAVNPLRFEIHIHDFRLTEADSVEVLGFDRLGVRLNPLPLLRGAITLSDVTLIRPRGRVILLSDGTLNWARLVRLPDSTAAPPAKEPPEFNLRRLKIADGELYFEDRTRTPAYDQQLRPINLELSNFSTKKNNENDYSLDAMSTAGEQFAWKGSFTMNPLRSDGSFAISHLKATSVGELAGPYLPFTLTGGTAEFSARYALDGSATPARLELSDLGSSLTDVGMAEKETALPLIEIKSLQSSGGSADVLTRQVSLGSVESTGGSLLLYMQPDGHTNYEAWAKPTGPVDTTQVWTTRIPSISITNWAMTFEDRRLTPAGRISVPACSVGVRDFSTAPGSRFALAANAALNGGGQARLAGHVTPGAPSTDLDLDLRGLELRELMPYVGMAAKIEITKGTGSAKGRIRTRPPTSREPQFQFVGNAQSQNFSSIDRRLRTELLSWRTLEIKGLTYEMLPSRIAIREITMSRPFVRAVVGPDRTTNLQDVAVPPDSLPPAFRPAPGAPDVPTTIDLVTFRDGAMYFADLTLTPNFATGIQSLNGTLKGLSSSAASHADLELDGKVDAYAPVRIFGTLNPLTEEQHSDITLDFKNIELTTFTPYAGKFMGYPIERGKLSLALNYKIDGRHLQGENKVLIEKLSLGQKTESPDATKLPIKFAIALLKDKDGNIDLDVPVSGDLDDPKFNIWRVLLKVLLNLITKLVTSPFKLMGALFGGGEDAGLETLSFAPGSAALTEAQTRKLAALGKGLNERPALRLDITETSDVVDSVAMARARFDRAILDERARTSRVLLDSVGIAEIPRDEYVRCLTGVYKARFGTTPRPDVSRAKGLKGAAKDSALAEINAQLAREMEFRVRESMTVAPADVALLARARSETIKSWLVTQGPVEPSRIFVVTSAEPVIADSVAVQVKLTLGGE